MFVLPNELIYLIAEYDYGLLCYLHITNHIIINKKQTTYNLLKYSIQQDYSSVLTHCMPYHNTVDWVMIGHLFEECVLYDSLKSIKYLYTNYNICDTVLCNSLIVAVNDNKINLIRNVVENTNIDLTYDNCKLLCEAIVQNNIQLVMYFMNSHNMEDCYGSYNDAFILAIELNRIQIVKFMITHPKVEVHEPDNEPFKIALLYRYKDIVKLFINNILWSNLHLDWYELADLRDLLGYSTYHICDDLNAIYN